MSEKIKPPPSPEMGAYLAWVHDAMLAIGEAFEADVPIEDALPVLAYTMGSMIAEFDEPERKLALIVKIMRQSCELAARDARADATTH